MGVLDLRFNNLDKQSVAKLRAAIETSGAQHSRKTPAANHRKITLRLKGNPGSDDMNENPIVKPQVAGGHLLPQIHDLVVAGWPRTSTAPDDFSNVRMRKGTAPADL